MLILSFLWLCLCYWGTSNFTVLGTLRCGTLASVVDCCCENWLMRFILLNTICLLPLSLYLSGNTILVISFWLPIRIQYLFSLIDNVEFFRYSYGLLDIIVNNFLWLIYLFILNILSIISSLSGFSFISLISFSAADINWYSNLIIVIIQLSMFFFFCLQLIRLLIITD